MWPVDLRDLRVRPNVSEELTLAGRDKAVLLGAKVEERATKRCEIGGRVHCENHSDPGCDYFRINRAHRIDEIGRDALVSTREKHLNS